MTKNRFLLIVAIVVIACVSMSCEKEIDIELDNYTEKLVVEGTIDLGEVPVVFLTRNIGFFEDIDTAYVNATIIAGDEAVVTVSVDDLVDTLQPAEFSWFPYHGYKGSKFVGEIGKAYDLRIRYNDCDYHSTTHILDTVALDSVKFQLSGKPADSTGFLTLFWTDKPEKGNHYSIYTKMRGQDHFLRPFYGTHIIDDKLLNAPPVVYGPLTKGAERNEYYYNIFDVDSLSELAAKIMFKIGDTVALRLSTLDDDSFLFWDSWYRSTVTDGNPFTNPASVVSNIGGSPAFGCWIGNGAFAEYVYIKDSASVEILPYP